MSRIGKNNFTLTQGPLRTRGPLEDGFTLVELMVVLVIIGLMSSFVMLNLPAVSTSAQEDAEHIAARFVAATREAVLSGETIGTTLTRDGYQFLRRRKGHWQAFEIMPNHSSYDWPQAGLVTFKLAGERQKLPVTSAVKDTNMPFLIFSPTGESVSFELIITKDGEAASVEGDYMSQIKVGREK